MFIKKSFVDEIADSLEKNIVSLSNEKETMEHDRKAKVIQYLTVAGDILDNAGLEKEAAIVTSVLCKIASSDPANPKSSEQAVKNLKERGSMFNAPKSDKANAEDKAIPKSSEQAVKNLKEKGWVFNVSDVETAKDDKADANDAGSVNWDHIANAYSSHLMKAMDGLDDAIEFLEKLKMSLPGSAAPAIDMRRQRLQQYSDDIQQFQDDIKFGIKPAIDGKGHYRHDLNKK